MIYYVAVMMMLLMIGLRAIAPVCEPAVQALHGAVPYYSVVEGYSSLSWYYMSKYRLSLLDQGVAIRIRAARECPPLLVP